MSYVKSFFRSFGLFARKRAVSGKCLGMVLVLCGCGFWPRDE
jgi:hypothetical protein